MEPTTDQKVPTEENTAEEVLATSPEPHELTDDEIAKQTEELENEIMEDADDIEAPQMDQEQLGKFLEALKNLEPDEREKLFENIANLNKINPEGKEFSQMDKKSFLRNKLRRRIMEKSVQRKSASVKETLREKYHATEEQDKEKAKKATRNKKRRERRKRKKQEESVDANAVEQEQQEESEQEPTDNMTASQVEEYNEGYELVAKDVPSDDSSSDTNPEN